MKIAFLFVFILAAGFACSAQKFKTIELKPIVKQGGAYLYDLKRVHGGAYGLQIPLQSLDDNEVNRYYKSFRTWKTVGAVFSLIPAVYFISISRSQTFDQNEFWITFGASMAGILATEIVANTRIKKGVDRYNSLVIGVSGQVVGPALTYRF
jgi:hypothetical protein